MSRPTNFYKYTSVSSGGGGGDGSGQDDDTDNNDLDNVSLAVGTSADHDNHHNDHYPRISRCTNGTESSSFETDIDSNDIYNNKSNSSSRQYERQQQQQQRRRRWYSGILFSVCTILLFADQNLMAPNLTAIAHDFNFDDQERDQKLGAAIALAFFVLGAPASFIVGCLADYDCDNNDNHNNHRFNCHFSNIRRPLLFAVTVGIGEGACLVTFFTKTYRQLYICRAITGFSLGGALPLVYSILGDLFAAQERHFVNALVGIGTGMGISLGQGVAGFLGPKYGWRLPFLVVSIPALVCALLVLLTVDDPPRGGMEKAVQDHRQNQNNLRQQQYDGNFKDNNNNNNSDNTLVEMVSLGRHTGTEDSGVDGAAAVSAAASSSFADERDETVVVPAKEEVRGHHDRDDMHVLPLDSSNSSMRITTHAHAHTQQHWWSVFCTLVSTPTVLLLLIQGAPGCLPWGIVNTYLNDFLAVDRGMSVEFATLCVLFFGIGNFFGLLLGGAGGSYLYRIDRRYPALLAGGTAAAGCLPFWLLLNIDIHNNNNNNNGSFVWIMALVGVAAGTLSGATGPVVKATLQNVTLPQTRGQAFALLNTFDDFGRGLGPVFIAAMIVHMGGRTPAFNVGTLGWAVCGLFNLLVFFTVERDEDAVQATIASQLQLAGSSNNNNNNNYEYLKDDSGRGDGASNDQDQDVTVSNDIRRRYPDWSMDDATQGPSFQQRKQLEASASGLGY